MDKAGYRTLSGNGGRGTLFQHHHRRVTIQAYQEFININRTQTTYINYIDTIQKLVYLHHKTQLKSENLRVAQKMTGSTVGCAKLLFQLPVQPRTEKTRLTSFFIRWVQSCKAYVSLCRDGRRCIRTSSRRWCVPKRKALCGLHKLSPDGVRVPRDRE